MRSVLTLLLIACGVFGLQLFQSVFGEQTSLSSLVPILFVLLALLTLVLKPKSVVLYGTGITLIFLIIVVAQIFIWQATFALNALTLMGAIFLCGALGLLFKKLWLSNWNEAKRYEQVTSDPWVSLDKGLDPTIESRMEDK